MAKVRGWVFTLNNPTEQEELLVKEFAKSYCKFLCFGREVGEQGTPHLQGNLQLKAPQRLSWLKDKLGDRTHFEERRGSEYDALKYNTKDGDYWIHDDRQPGSRSDILNAVRCESIQQVVDEHPEVYVKFHAGIEKLFLRREQRYEGDRKVIWLHGLTGTGKTYEAVREGGAKEVSWNNGFLIGYEGEETVVFDEFDKRSDISLSMFLRLTDNYPLTVNVKNGQRHWNARTIYITSTVEPRLAFKEMLDQVSWDQVARRLFLIVHKTMKYIAPSPTAEEIDECAMADDSGDDWDGPKTQSVVAEAAEALVEMRYPGPPPLRGAYFDDDLGCRH